MSFFFFNHTSKLKNYVMYEQIQYWSGPLWGKLSKLLNVVRTSIGSDPSNYAAKKRQHTVTELRWPQKPSVRTVRSNCELTPPRPRDTENVARRRTCPPTRRGRKAPAKSDGVGEPWAHSPIKKIFHAPRVSKSNRPQ